MREEESRERDLDYEEYREWRRQRSRPWFNQGWFWALIAVAGLALLLWQLGNIGEAVQSSAAATREQTSAIREQTQVMREQGSWIIQQLRAIEQAITTLGHYVREGLESLGELKG